MKTAIIISEQHSIRQWQESHLMCLALLNFEHHVEVIFMGHAVELLKHNAALKKSWLALKLYGVKNFYHLSTDDSDESHPETEEHFQSIDIKAFAELKNNMDWLL